MSYHACTPVSKYRWFCFLSTVGVERAGHSSFHSSTDSPVVLSSAVAYVQILGCLPLRFLTVCWTNRKCRCCNTTQASAIAGLQRRNLSHCLSASWEPYAALCLYPVCFSCLSSLELHHYRYHCLVDRFRICLCLLAAHLLPDLQLSPEIVNTILSRLHLCLLLSLVMYCALQAVIIIMSKHSTPTAWLTSNASTTFFRF